MGLEISMRYSTITFHPMSAKLYDGIGLEWWNAGYYFFVVAIVQLLNILWHFQILTWDSIGKPKMYHISKTTDPRTKRTKIWDSAFCSAHTRVLFMPDCLSLVWGHPVHVAKFAIL